MLIWLILPVVICFFQGLSHANVSGSDFRRDCVRLIKRLIVYPTEFALVQTHGITAPKRAANTWTTNPLNINQAGGETLGAGWRMLLAETKTNANWQLQLLTQANVAEALTRVVGRIHHLSD